MWEEVGTSLSLYAVVTSLICRMNCLQNFNWELNLEYTLSNLKQAWTPAARNIQILLGEGTGSGHALRCKWWKMKPCCCEMVKHVIDFVYIGCLLQNLLLDCSFNILSNKGNFQNMEVALCSWVWWRIMLMRTSHFFFRSM